MTNETTSETVSDDEEKPFETNGLNAYSPLEHEETIPSQSQAVSKKPFETGVFNHGTGKVTFTQALQLITASKATLSRYSNDGKLSFETNEEGHKIYQVAELERVFGKLKSPETKETVSEEVQSNHLKPSEPDNETTLKLALLEQENHFLREKAEHAQREAEDWKQQATRAMLMLTHQPTPAAPVAAQEPPAPEPKPEPPTQPKKKFLGIFGGR